MTRLAVAGCMALAALGAVAVLDVGAPAAEAAPTVSPFAGSYVGYVPGGGSRALAISGAGRITCPSSNPEISGRVSADGSYSLTVSQTVSSYDERRDRIQTYTSNFKSIGSMTLDPDGNIVGTSNRDTNGFVWLRQ